MRLLLTIVIVLMSLPSVAWASPPVVEKQNPANLPWRIKLTPNKIVNISGYRYAYGDIAFGSAHYYSNYPGFLNVEMVLEFTTKGYIKTATLLFGPEGITEKNCLSVYRRITKALNKKYGKYKSRILTKEDLLEDLVFDSKCYALSVGVYEIETRWSTKEFDITLFIFSDEDTREINIELEYSYKPLNTLDKDLALEKLL